LLGLVLFNADLIYLRFISGQASAGYYSAAYTFIAFAANLGVAWAHSVMPSLASIERTDARRNTVFETALLLAYVVALPVAVGGMLTARPLMELVFGPAFLPAVAALVWLLPAVPIAAVREIAVVGLIGSPGGERKLIRINASCAISNIAILLPVVPALRNGRRGSSHGAD
jgi:O-antigen/teichoic acid export membrane protein